MANLRNVILDICLRAGLTVDQVDVSQINGSLDGFALSNRSTSRSMLEPLQKAFFFDACESGNVIKFFPINRAAVATIDVSELIPLNGGEETEDQDFLQIGLTDGSTTPKTLSVVYISSAADYQQGTQEAFRQIAADDGDENTENLPIVMTEGYAKYVAETLLYMNYINRTTFNFALPTKYIALEPGDIIYIVDGQFTHVIRILKKKTQLPAIIFEGMAYDSTNDDRAPVPGDIVIVKDEVQAPGDTLMIFLDLPMLRSADNDPGFYMAADRLVQNWGGARIYRSDDDVNYDILTTIGLSTASGVTLGTLGVGSPYFLDRANHVDVVLNYSDQLVSATMDSVLNGNNACVIGDEIVQFTTADLIGTNTYRLSGLLRGRMGTEAQIPLHATGDRFVMLNPGGNLVRIYDGTGVINSDRYYKGVTVGGNLQSVTAEIFANTGNSVRPWSPVQFKGSRDSGTGDWSLSWIRRTRFNGSWIDNVDVPINEESESYTLEICDFSTGTILQQLTISGQSDTVYTAAQQTALFGSTQTNLRALISQNSSVIGAGYRTEGIFNG